jgi:hypothetical protein
MFSQELRLLIDYTHLNLPQKKIGIFNGKGAAILLFASLKHAYSKQTSLNLLEETLAEISTQVPVNFGSGLSGLACTIDHLASCGYILQDVSELLRETEKRILDSFTKAELNDISINSGISGIGLFFLKRLTSQPLKDIKKREVYLEILAGLFDKAVSHNSLLIARETKDHSLWTGLSGYMLFLFQAANVLFFEPHLQIEVIEERLISILEDKMVPNWEKVEIYFVLLIVSSPENHPLTKKTLKLFNEFVISLIENVHEVDIKSGLFLAMLLTKISQKFEVANLDQLTQLIIYHVKTDLTEDKITGLFPGNNYDRSVNVGIASGTCGLALSLYSLEHNDYSWLNLILSEHADISENS